MAELQTVARPYAEAAFEIARDAKALPAWSEALHNAAAIVADARMQAALDNPGLTSGQKESMLLSVVGDKLPPDGQKFLRVLIDTDRVALLPQISDLFEARKNDAEKVAKADIETAIALDDAQLTALKAALARHFGKTIEASVRVNPQLIGGARITVGDRVIDGSVQGKLTTMANELSA